MEFNKRNSMVLLDPKYASPGVSWRTVVNTHSSSQRSSLQLGGAVYKFKLLWVGHLATAPEAHLSSPEEGRGGRGGTPLREWAVARVMVIRG